MNTSSGRVPAGDRRSRPVVRLICDDHTSLCPATACGSGVEGGMMRLMNAIITDPREVLIPFGDSNVIPLPAIGDYVGMTRDTRDYAVRKGLIRTVPGPKVPGRGKSRSLLITRDEAILIIVSAALAVSIGIAVTTVIKTLRASGATIGAGGVTIPLAGLAALGNSAGVSAS